MPIVRMVHASTSETIEIIWVRRIPDPSDPAKDLTQQLVERHTAPPSAVWDTKLQEPSDPHD